MPRAYTCVHELDLDIGIGIGGIDIDIGIDIGAECTIPTLNPKP